jgi:hypothetical protein
MMGCGVRMRTSPKRPRSRLYLAGELTPRGFREKNRVQLETEIPRLQGEIDFLEIQQLSQAEGVPAAKDLSSRWFEIPP